MTQRTSLHDRLAWTIPLAIIVATVLLEYFSPLGLAAGLPYVLLVALCAHPRWTRFVWRAAGLSTALVLAAAAVKFDAGSADAIWLMNRASTVLAIWGTAIAVAVSVARQKPSVLRRADVTIAAEERAALLQDSDEPARRMHDRTHR